MSLLNFGFCFVQRLLGSCNRYAIDESVVCIHKHGSDGRRKKKKHEISLTWCKITVFHSLRNALTSSSKVVTLCGIHCVHSCWTKWMVKVRSVSWPSRSPDLIHNSVSGSCEGQSGIATVVKTDSIGSTDTVVSRNNPVKCNKHGA
jgi:hypothetical protein